MLKIRDLEMLDDISLVYKNKIVLYGADDFVWCALKLLRLLEIPVYGICDSNESLWEKEIKGNKILSLMQLIEIYKRENISIIMTMANTADVEQALETLEEYGISDVECYTYFALKFTIELHINDYRISNTYRENFNKARMLYIEYVFKRLRVESRCRCGFESMLYDSILIWQPGKVGSMTIEKSLNIRNIHCIHTHELSRGDYESKIDYDNRISLLRNMEKVRIISLVRDPVARSISLFFQGMHVDGYILQELGDCEGNTNILSKLFTFTEQESKMGQYGYMFEWFNHEIKEVLGIDVYQHDFDKEKGYQLIHQDNIELLLIKTEKLNECQEVIGKFVEAENFKLVNDNVGNQKPYKFVYNEIKKSIRIPEHIMNFYYKGNKAMDHFYTEEEKENLIKKWSGILAYNFLKKDTN